MPANIIKVFLPKEIGQIEPTPKTYGLSCESKNIMGDL